MSQKHSTTKTRSFQHLTPFQRGQIQALMEQKLPKTQIAKQVGIARSTLYEELKRGTVNQMRSDLTYYQRYFADTGQLVYEENRKASRKPYKLAAAAPFLQHLETEVLQNKISPDAVCGRAKLDKAFPVTLCTKTIYNYIDLGLVPIKSIDLPLRVRRTTKKHHCRKNRRLLGESIEQRPQAVNDRQEFGHWEIDTVVGKREAGEVLLTLDERMTRRRHVLKISGKTKEGVAAGLETLRRQYGALFPKVFRSITSDNGSEFSDLTELFKEGKVYFSHPYSSGERGTNEKQNSLVRRFIPKGKDISTVPDYVVQKAQDWINALPRRIFGYRTSEELFNEQISLLSSAA